MNEPRGNLLPIYFVADASGSMADRIGELNAGMTSLVDQVALDGVSAAKLRFTVLSFSDEVVSHLELADLREVTTMPTFSSGGQTAYGVVFADLRRRIEADVPRLKADGYRVHRPAVFFLTDGMPTDLESWPAALAALKAPDWPLHPNIVAFGIGTADAATLHQVATKPEFAWVAASGVDTGKALAEFFSTFTQSVVSSARSIAAGAADLEVKPPEGFKMAIDLV